MKSYAKTVIAILVCTTSLMAMKSLQPRTMPLVPMMQQLLQDMVTVNRGIYTEDFRLVEEGAMSIAEHPVMTERDKELVKATLGEEMQQFVAFDGTVHHHADSMAAAARRQNMQGVLNHYRIVQQGCVDCHSSYRMEISNARVKQADE